MSYPWVETFMLTLNIKLRYEFGNIVYAAWKCPKSENNGHSLRYTGRPDHTSELVYPQSLYLVWSSRSYGKIIKWVYGLKNALNDLLVLDIVFGERDHNFMLPATWRLITHLNQMFLQKVLVLDRISILATNPSSPIWVNHNIRFKNWLIAVVFHNQ